TGDPIRIARLLRLLVAQSRVPLRVEAPAGRPDLSSGDASKFRAHTGWRPEIPLEQTLSDLLEHERRRAELATK
ncbi:MAG: GDP-mannose 4,6 dehydratase, partial [Planctomycetes bacterium]|nr:GDP-mannose 4,6 dehydratase [Planctomycetota bacterium]